MDRDFLTATVVTERPVLPARRDVPEQHRALQRLAASPKAAYRLVPLVSQARWVGSV
jgi:hypothetical protein